jgi:N6-adenosine-specific RNA methylase IME4
MVVTTMQYNVITLDPPWEYERTAGQGVANKQYGLMGWDALRSLGPLLHSLAAPNCAVFLWTCAPLLMETAELVKAWDFRYITKAFSWLKTYPDGSYFVGLGSHTRGNTEDVWLLSNGTPRRKNTDVYQIIPTMEREAIQAPLNRHSEKPAEFYRRVERYLDGPYLEVFGRKRRDGWDAVGNELDGLDVREALARLAADEALPVVKHAISQPILF